jgi:hypothetical protein
LHDKEDLKRPPIKEEDIEKLLGRMDLKWGDPKRLKLTDLFRFIFSCLSSRLCCLESCVLISWGFTALIILVN